MYKALTDKSAGALYVQWGLIEHRLIDREVVGAATGYESTDPLHIIYKAYP